MKKSKLYRSRLEMIDRSREYDLEEELTFRLGVDPRQSDQIVRGVVDLPNGTGKTTRVVVIAEGEAAEEAREAGADYVGGDELVERIKGGWLDFDLMIATSAAMRSVRPLGRVLGPRGLMPNPKTGTVTDTPGEAVRGAKAGRAEYRADRGGCVHVPIGKRSFTVEALLENAMSVIQGVMRARPAAAKGTYVLGVTVCSTMSPGVKVDTKVTKA
jgi:large subunit ribosomal protein L1